MKCSLIKCSMLNVQCSKAQAQGSSSFREHRIDMIEQRAGSALLDERDEPYGWILLRVDRQRGLQQFLEFRTVLRRYRDPDGKRDVWTRRQPCWIQRPSRNDRGPEPAIPPTASGRLSSETNISCSAPLLQVSSRANARSARARTTGISISRSGLIEPEADRRSPRGGHPIQQRHVLLFRLGERSRGIGEQFLDQYPETALPSHGGNSPSRAGKASGPARSSARLRRGALLRQALPPRSPDRRRRYCVKLLQVAIRRSLFFGAESSSDSYSFSPNGIASPTSSGSSSRVNTSPLEASVLATIPTALRCTSPHAGNAAAATAMTTRREATEWANVCMLNSKLYNVTAGFLQYRSIGPAG